MATATDLSPTQHGLTTGCGLGFLGVLVLLLGACAQHQNRPSDSAAVTPPANGQHQLEQDLRFSPDTWPQTLHADLYTPAIESPDGGFPAMIMVHGGGWEGRSRQDMNRAARRFANAGYLVLNIDYRFAPEYPYPEAVHDVQQALRWLHEQAGALSVDTGRIGLLGFSSGAHLASLAALTAGTDHELDQPWSGAAYRPAAVVVGGTPTDLRKFGSGRLVEQFLGGTMEAVPARYEAASPVTQVHADSPPFFHFHGTWDRLVPPDHSSDFHAELLAAGVHSELYRMRLRGHATSLVFSGDALSAAVDFMNHQLYP
ncbi:alpha/beta hydrolase [Natronospirillum operosum]|uniref:Alpha/beta hydrolase n=1 Tax=Natronospirillum operosum TaxID=2759953 RepID=A0A4Z0W5F8_9GAMM|nr:alpha/beta hydrolase [Natronospirillum operosum]TGG91119.1 alpha/beta hydrolase [Natronospirillum operosum]